MPPGSLLNNILSHTRPGACRFAFQKNFAFLGDKLLDEALANDNRYKNKSKSSNFPEIEQVMLAVMDEAEKQKMTLTSGYIRNMALELAKQLGIENFNASQGWLQRFQVQNNNKIPSIISKNSRENWFKSWLRWDMGKSSMMGESFVKTGRSPRHLFGWHLGKNTRSQISWRKIQECNSNSMQKCSRRNGIEMLQKGFSHIYAWIIILKIY